MKIRNYLMLGLLSSMVVALPGHAQQNFSEDIRRAGDSARIVSLPTQPGKQEAYFVNLKENDVVRSPFRVVFGVIGFGVAPAGVSKEGTGHHHLLVNTTMPADLTQPLPFSNKYIHFDSGQTEAELNLPPGKHTLQLLFADYEHKPMHKTKSGSGIVANSKKITIIVEEPAKVAANTR